VPKKLAPVFRDRDELASSTALGEALTAALRASKCQIVICSPSAARSKWVNEEILAFKRLGGEDRIFSFIVDGEPNVADDPARAAEECFPPALRFHLGEDGNLGTRPCEPIAADARAGKDGRGGAKLKLIAGILGVGLDSLRRREQQRRQRRLFAIASGAVAGMVITTGLATAALIARAQAQRQTVIAKREAETARQTTAFLVGLFKISDPSEARGNALTAREVLDKGAARVQTQLRDQPAIRATLMDTLGTVYMGLGLYTEAKPLLDTAVDTRRGLTPAEPAELAASMTHVGDLLTHKAEYPAADKAYRDAIALQEALPVEQRDPTALGKSLYGLGNELEYKGVLPEAEATLRKALTLQQQVKAPPEDTARTLQQLAWTVNERNPSESIALMERAVAMQRALWGTQPYPDYADAVNDLGVMYRDQGDYVRAESLMRESLAMYRRLLGDKHADLSFALVNLGGVQQLKGDLDAADVTLHEALAMQRELLGEIHPEVAKTLNNIACLYDDKGDVHAALATELQALEINRKVFPGDNPEVARIMNRVGYWYTQTGNYSAAEGYLQQALAMRQRLFPKDSPEIASSLMHLAALQVAMHRYPEALQSGQTAASVFEKAFSADNWRTAFSESVSGAALSGMGDYSHAEQRLVRGYGVLSKDAAVLRTYRTLTRGYLENLYVRWGRPQQAERYAAAVYKQVGAVPQVR
jgi:tetratricopeptide (TPR) repeat protein